MTLECINPEDLPTPLTYTQVVVATGSRLVSSPARNLKTSTATSSVPVTWLSRPARCLPTWAVRSLPPTPGLTR